ncbi:MAG TPA: DUF481 domain-containing protein [Gemmatimonadales bacterium]|nr:DUF481 domain-containing protein [Gemmatimonadales bacterium]
MNRSRRPSPRRLPLLALLAGLATALGPAVAAAQKTDVVVLRNGDKLTGEIKGLSRGLLDYSTDDVGRLKVEWIKLLRITSRMYYEVEVRHGRKYFGRLDPPAEDGKLVVALEPLADTLAIAEVVAITPIGARFVSRLKAYLDIGFTLAKAQWATTLNGAGEVRYRGPTVGAGFSFSSYVQSQEDVETTARHSIQLDVGRYLGSRDVLAAILLVERNDELDLELRLTGGGAFGRTLVRTNATEVSAFAGAVVSQERTTLTDPAGPSDTTTTSVEGYLRFSWSAFRYDQPKLDLSTIIEAFPSFAEGGGLRLNLGVRLKYELFTDFNVGLSFQDAYDGNPAGDAPGRNDFVTAFTVGWSYRR